MAPPKLLVVNFPINLRCYVLLGCRVINVILAIHIGDSAFFDVAALVRNSVVYGITSRRNRASISSIEHRASSIEHRASSMIIYLAITS